MTLTASAPTVPCIFLFAVTHDFLLAKEFVAAELTKLLDIIISFIKYNMIENLRRRLTYFTNSEELIGEMHLSRSLN
jgi:hypothetical protein